MLDLWNKKITALFGNIFEPQSESCDLNEHQRQLTSAALMIEVAVIDSHFDSTELETVSQALRLQFDLNKNEVDTLISLAQQERDDASSLYQFTHLVNENFELGEKYKLIVAMWQTAYADGNIDKYEESIIRKVADLIHLSHSDFIRAKHQARG